MKKLIFVLLKLIEIPAIVFVPYYVGYFVFGSYSNVVRIWMGGVLVLIATAVCGFVAYVGLSSLVKGNIKLTNWINNKLKR